MRTSVSMLALGALLAWSAPAARAGDDATNWYDDYDKALAAAKAENKDLLVDFSGSDWCGWCIKLHEEVFAHESFTNGARKGFVLCVLDFPRGEEAKAKVPNPKRNQELSQQHGVRGFPTVLLMSSEGEVYAQTGYRPGGPEKYLKEIEQCASTKPLVKGWDAADDVGKVALCKKATGLLTTIDDDAPAAGALQPMVAWGVTADPKNEKGLHDAALTQLALKGLADPSLLSEVKVLDPKNEKGLQTGMVGAAFRAAHNEAGARAAIAVLKTVDELGVVKHKDAATWYFYAAVWSHKKFGYAVAAKHFAERARDAGVEHPQWKAALEEILGGATSENEGCGCGEIEEGCGCGCGCGEEDDG
jgi:thioredoxin-related protein